MEIKNRYVNLCQVHEHPVARHQHEHHQLVTQHAAWSVCWTYGSGVQGCVLSGGSLVTHPSHTAANGFLDQLASAVHQTEPDERAFTLGID